MKRSRGNPLLSKPPGGIHGLGVAQGRRAQQVLGRPVRASDYEGVHTTDSLALAATYAIGAADAARKDGHGDAYPVVLELDVAGLTALPDIDAVVEATALLNDRSIRKQYQGMSLLEANDSEESDESFEEGDNVIAIVIGQQQHGRIPSAFGALPDDDADAAFEHWVQTGEYPEEVAIALVNQKRYLVDIGFDRLVRVLAVKRWWPEALGYGDDDEVQEEAERLEAQGYAVVTSDEYEIDTTTIPVYEGPTRRNAVTDYHGTSSWHATAAFPELSLPPDPFPIVDENPRGRDMGTSNPEQRFYVKRTIDSQGGLERWVVMDRRTRMAATRAMSKVEANDELARLRATRANNPRRHRELATRLARGG